LDPWDYFLPFGTETSGHEDWSTVQPFKAQLELLRETDAQPMDIGKPMDVTPETGRSIPPLETNISLPLKVLLMMFLFP